MKFEQILETIKYEDLVDVYLNQHLSIDNCAKVLGVCGETFTKLVKHYGLTRTTKTGPKVNKRFNETVSRINKEEFVDDYINKNMSHQDMQTKYNVTSYTLDKLIEHFNCHKSRTQSAVLVQQTKYEQAGSKEEYIKQCTEKSRNTKIKTFGSFENYHNHMKNKVQDSFKKNNSVHKMEETKKINQSFNKSKPEDNYYEYLKTIYNEDDIIRQYKDERYPFACDFYIKSEDLFIECNYSWTHGGHLFNPDSKEDQKTLAEWQEKAKTSDFYKNAIETWTVRDTKKHETAKANNLNYEVLY